MYGGLRKRDWAVPSDKYRGDREEGSAMSNKKRMFVDAAEISEDWGVSKSQAYKIIKQLNEKMLAMNPNLIVLSGKANRKFYEENCYGTVKR